MFKKFGSKSDVTHTQTCTIRFLDDAEPMKVTYEAGVSGQWVLDYVCKDLNIMEKDYFGLRYIDKEKQRHWLDPLRSAYKQLRGINPPVLCFRVKFYPEDPMKLQEEITRFFLFLQLRRDLHHGRLLCAPNDANLLAAYVIQSEVGDYDPEDHEDGYISKFKMLPNQSDVVDEKIAEIHKTLSGRVPAQVEREFLQKVYTMETYGVDPHSVKDQKGNQIYLGTTYLGVVTFMGTKRTHLFQWDNVDKIAYDGKMFILHIIFHEGSNGDIGATKRKKHIVGFKCSGVAACKHLWRCAIVQQSFFTLSKSSEAKKFKSGGGFFKRSSKYRFSGRCQREVLEDTISRPQPQINRSLSNPSFLKSYKRISNQSLPSNLHNTAPSKENNVLTELYEKIVTTPSPEADNLLETTLETTTTIPEENEVTIAEGTTYKPDETERVTPEPPNMEIDRDQADGDKDDDTILGNHIDETMDATAASETEAMTTAVEDQIVTSKVGIEEANPKTVETNEVKSVGGMSCLCALLLSIFFTLVFMCVAVYVLFESELQQDFIIDLREIPQIALVKEVYYVPFKEYAEQKIFEFIKP